MRKLTDICHVVLRADGGVTVRTPVGVHYLRYSFEHGTLATDEVPEEWRDTAVAGVKTLAQEFTSMER